MSILYSVLNKSSPVGEMGNSLVTTDMGQKVRAAMPLSTEELGPQITQCRLGRDLPPYHVVS